MTTNNFSIPFSLFCQKSKTFSSEINTNLTDIALNPISTCQKLELISNYRMKNSVSKTSFPNLNEKTAFWATIQNLKKYNSHLIWIGLKQTTHKMHLRNKNHHLP